MSGVSLSAMILRDGNNDQGSDDPKVKLRAQLAKDGVTVGREEDENNQQQEENADANDEENEEEEEGEENEEDEEVDDTKKEETDEEKAEREKQEKIQAKAQRKQDRMQRRIDEATAARRTAEAEVERLKAQLEANPDQKLTAEEVEQRAEAIAARKLAEKNEAEIRAKFDKDCEKLQKAANKVDKDFDDKIADIAADIGPIPSFMIGVLDDLDNGGEVLAHIANDDELAEEIWKMKPTRMTKKLLDISENLKPKPKKKEISKVPAGPDPVKTNRSSNSAIITEADTKDMDSYVAKRRAQMADKRKAQGF